MDVIFRTEDLLTAVGCGGVTLLVLQFVVKRILDALESSNPTWLMAWRSAFLNVTALVVSIGAAFAGQAVLGITYESGLQALLTGLGGMAIATTSYETLKNVIRLARR